MLLPFSYIASAQEFVGPYGVIGFVCSYGVIAFVGPNGVLVFTSSYSLAALFGPYRTIDPRLYLYTLFYIFLIGKFK